MFWPVAATAIGAAVAGTVRLKENSQRRCQLHIFRGLE